MGRYDFKKNPKFGMIDIPFCRLGKKSYPTRALALSINRNRRNKDRKRLRAYVCTVCHGWHLTSGKSGVWGGKI